MFLQICNHPSLIKQIIDNEAKETAGLDANDENDDLISKMTNMSICQEKYFSHGPFALFLMN